VFLSSSVIVCGGGWSLPFAPSLLDTLLWFRLLPSRRSYSFPCMRQGFPYCWYSSSPGLFGFGLAWTDPLRPRRRPPPFFFRSFSSKAFRSLDFMRFSSSPPLYRKDLDYTSPAFLFFVVARLPKLLRSTLGFFLRDIRCSVKYSVLRA